MQLYIAIFAFIFYRISFKLVYEENIAILADAIICLLVFAVSTFISLQASAILLEKSNSGDPYSYERGKVKNQSFIDIFYFTGFLLIPFNFFAILVIFGFSDNLWDYGIIGDGYFLVTASLLTAPVFIHAVFEYRRAKFKFLKNRG